MLSMDEIYRAHATMIYRYLLALSGDAHTAEELTQETFYQALRCADRYDGSCKETTWLCSIAKNQFLACQFTIVVSLLPTMMLTGFLFDLRSVPDWIRIVGYLLPATYYMEIAKTLFLAGNSWPLLIKNSLILCVYAVIFLGLALHVTRKRLE